MKATSGLPKLGGGGQSGGDRDRTEVDRRVTGGVKEWRLSVPHCSQSLGQEKEPSWSSVSQQAVVGGFL